MGKTGGQSGAQSADEAMKAADRLREATDLLGGAQKQQASGKLDQLGRDADRLSKEENAEADRVRKLAAAGEAMQAKRNAGGEASASDLAAAEKERQSLANDRQRMSDDLEKLEKGMRDAARELAGTQPGAATSLRDTLSGMDQQDLTNLVQRTADWLRSGINPNSNGTEAEIASGLKKVDDGVRQAQQAAGSGQNGRTGMAPGTQTAALDHLDRLRSQIAGLTPGQGSPNGQRGQQPGQNGQQGRAGSQGQQQGQGQQGSQRGQGGQQGQGQQGQGRQGQGQQQGQGQGQQGQGQQAGQNGRGGGQGGQQQGGQQGQQNAQGGRQGGGLGPRGGQLDGGYVNGPLRGGGGSTDANLAVDTGGQTYGSGAGAFGFKTGGNPVDTQRVIQQGMGELNQLRQVAKGDPAVQKQIDDLEKELQKLDPSRFPGNPAMVEELHTKVLNDVDKLELQLRRDPNQPQAGQVRTATPPNVPAGYEDAVAEYYRRLSKGQ